MNNERLIKAVVVCLFWAISQGCLPNHPFSHEPDVSMMPGDVIYHLNQEIKDRFVSECGDEHAEIVDISTYERDNQDLLLFLYLPDYLCTRSNSFVPVTVSLKGQWAWGNRISGLASLCVEDKDGILWLITQWAVEGSYPELYRSPDGVTWARISLPENRQVDCCFEFVSDICVYKDQIRLRFEGGDTDAKGDKNIEYWSTARTMTQNPPVWKRVAGAHISDHGCESRPLDRGNWVRQDKGDSFYLFHAHPNRVVICPKTISSPILSPSAIPVP